MREEGKKRRGQWEAGTMQSLLNGISEKRVFVVRSSQLLNRKFCGTTGLCTAYSHILLVSGHTWDLSLSLTGVHLYEAQEKRALP